MLLTASTVWLALHFHLGVLILADVLVVGSATLSPQHAAVLAEHRLSSTRSVVNIANLVRQYDSSNLGISSLLLRDPYPEHASNCFSRAARSIVNLVGCRVITPPVATVMASALFHGLDTIRHISWSANDSLPALIGLFRDRGITVSSPDLASLHTTSSVNATAAILDAAVTPEMLESETLKELGVQAVADPSLVTKTIERHEVAEFNMDFGLDYLHWIDFTAVMGDWEFQDCFSVE